MKLESGVLEPALTGDSAPRAAEPEGLPPGPVDRLIAAPALVNDATLVTADRLSFTGGTRCAARTQHCEAAAYSAA